MDRETKIERYFFDTYAIVEILKNNPNYISFKDEQTIFTIFNLAELYLSILRDYNKEKADLVYEVYKSSIVEIPDKTLKGGMKFKQKYKKRRLSYTDCIGYIYAKDYNLKFLTGDKEFWNLPNVEFVK
jgi:uncharacterized protein